MLYKMSLHGEGCGANFIVCPRVQNILATRLDQCYQHVYFNEHHKDIKELNFPVNK